MSTLRYLLSHQDEIKQVFQDALSAVEDKTIPPRCLVETHNTVGVLYKGYKVSCTKIPNYGLVYELMNTNTSDFYKWVDRKSMDDFLTHGFLRTCNLHQLERLKTRLKMYNNKINGASQDRNDSLMVHWKKKRVEALSDIIKIEEFLAVTN